MHALALTMRRHERVSDQRIWPADSCPALLNALRLQSGCFCPRIVLLGPGREILKKCDETRSDPHRREEVDVRLAEWTTGSPCDPDNLVYCHRCKPRDLPAHVFRSAWST